MRGKEKRVTGSAERKRREGTYEKGIQGRREQWKGRGLQGREKKQSRHKRAVANRINRLSRKRKRRGKVSENPKPSNKREKRGLNKKKGSRAKRLSKKREKKRRRRRRRRQKSWKGKVREKARENRKATRNRRVLPFIREWWFEKEVGRRYKERQGRRSHESLACGLGRKKVLIVRRRLVSKVLREEGSRKIKRRV
jgi:hypothetical protein